MNGECCDPSLAVLFSVPPDFVTPAARTYNWVIHRVWRKGRERSVEKAAQPKGQDFCGCRPGCKKFLNLWVGDRVRSSVRPLIAAYSEADGRYGDPRIRSKIGSASCRERVCKYVWIWVVAVA